MNVTRKQHYVQQEYLHNWEENHQFSVYDKLDKTNKIRLKGTKAICFEWYYYKLYRLTDDEKRIFNVLYKDVPPKLKSIIEELNNLLYNEIKIDCCDKNIESAVTDILNENRQEIENLVFTQMGESLLCDIEKGLSKDLWKKLLSKDEAFINDEQQRFNFFCYIMGQMWRVPSKKKKLEGALKILTLKNGAKVSAEHMFPYFVYYQSMIEACYMSYRNKHKLAYLSIPDNCDDEFITSDNPIINLCNDYDINGSPITYDLYWAVTPKLALIITENQAEHSRNVTKEDTQRFNKLIFNNATRYVISHSKESLLNLLIFKRKTISKQ